MIRRSGIYGPRDYLRIVQEQIRYWKIEKLRRAGRAGPEGAGEDHGDPGPAAAHRRADGDPEPARRPSASRSCSTANSRWNEPLRVVAGPGARLRWSSACGDRARSDRCAPRPAAELPRTAATPRRSAGRCSSWWTARWTTAAHIAAGPPTSLRQMGVDSLTPTTARHLVNVNREPVVTVQFRKVGRARDHLLPRGQPHPRGGHHQRRAGSP